MEKKYLDGSGVQILWTKTKNLVEATETKFTTGTKTAYKAIRDGNGSIISDTYVKTSTKGVANGLATLDSTGKVPLAQLPSYVDDVVECATLPASGESGKIYVLTGTNVTYRWSGSSFVEISASLALGTTSSTAFAGDRGVALETRATQIESDVDDKLDTSASSSLAGLNKSASIDINSAEIKMTLNQNGPSPDTSGNILENTVFKVTSSGAYVNSAEVLDTANTVAITETELNSWLV